MAQLADDPEYQRKLRIVRAERQVINDELRKAEQPIVRDLRTIGHDISSVWDLVNTSQPYPDALPVLLEHLTKGGYPDRVMEGLGSALAVRPAAFAWMRLRELYLSAQGPGETEGLAVALAASSTSEHLEEMIALLHEGSRGDSRIHLLGSIKRTGGRRGLDILASLTKDPVFGREATALLKKRR